MVSIEVSMVCMESVAIVDLGPVFELKLDNYVVHDDHLWNLNRLAFNLHVYIENVHEFCLSLLLFLKDNLVQIFFYLKKENKAKQKNVQKFENTKQIWRIIGTSVDSAINEKRKHKIVGALVKYSSKWNI